jgi:ribosomal protein L14E/L6E/L27E
MARIRRSKTNTTHFMDIPKNHENKRYKEQEEAKKENESLYN